MSKINNKSELLKRLGELEKEYNDAINQNSAPTKFERIEYDAPSDDEITKLAKSSIEKNYGNKKDASTRSYESKKASLTESLEKALKDAENAKALSEERFKDSKGQVENEAMKRGLQRSSVVMGEIGKLEAEKNKELAQTDANYNAEKLSVEKEIEKLTAQLSDALNKLDMEKAIAINEKIEELKAERDKKQNDVTKYNNSLTEKEEKQRAANEKANKDVNEKTKQTYMKKKVSEVLDYYLAFEDPQDALDDFVGDYDVSKYLGKYYYYIYNILKTRA